MFALKNAVVNVVKVFVERWLSGARTHSHTQLNVQTVKTELIFVLLAANPDKAQQIHPHKTGIVFLKHIAYTVYKQVYSFQKLQGGRSGEGKVKTIQ